MYKLKFIFFIHDKFLTSELLILFFLLDIFEKFYILHPKGRPRLIRTTVPDRPIRR